MSTGEALDRCAECGGAQASEIDCEGCFHALLAFENERPAVFSAVHHMTVSTYYLQHPSGYTLGALRMWRDVVTSSLNGAASGRDMLRRASREFSGATRVRDPVGVPPAAWPRSWPITVQDVLRPGDVVSAIEYIERARRWASETCRVLGDAGALPVSKPEDSVPRGAG